MPTMVKAEAPVERLPEHGGERRPEQSRDRQPEHDAADGASAFVHRHHGCSDDCGDTEVGSMRQARYEAHHREALEGWGHRAQDVADGKDAHDEQEQRAARHLLRQAPQ